MHQRDELHDAEHRLAVIRKEQQRLERRPRSLQRPREIERLARERFGMVRPGEQACAVVPGPADDHHARRPRPPATP